jgi:3-hydroxy acid dehydrogenase/malonic semialdehyde reductase
MNRIKGKLALVTGATSGFGLATARRLAADGANLVLWARRQERLDSIAPELRKLGVNVRTDVVDVRDRSLVNSVADDLVRAGLVPDILLNNAGLAAGLSGVQDGDPDDWDRMIDTNIKGLLNVTRALLPHMIARNAGHIVNIGSTAGHQTYPKGNVYNATKFGVRALTEGMNLDVAGTALRVSAVDPGFAETEFSVVRFHGDAERAKSVYKGFQPLSAEDVADVIMYVLNLPEHVNILNCIVMPTAQRNIYVVDRKP